MASAMGRERRNAVAVFDLFVRTLPPGRSALIACGIEDAIAKLEAWRFDADDLRYLEGLSLFETEFLDWLASVRFTGDVWALDEGEAVFPDEPILSVRAPFAVAQLLETLLLNVIGFQTMVATKAALVAEACDGRAFVDFSARRDHGLDAALSAARAAFVGGASATSLVEAGKRFGIAVSGTMAHSFVMAFDREVDAFCAYLERYPRSTILLVDTYDSVEGTRAAMTAMKRTAIRARAVRLDSGDLEALSRAVRHVLDEGGYQDVQIFVSGDLDEQRVRELLSHGAPIDAFGVGTRMGTSADHPYLAVVYKLVEFAGEGRLKLSAGKVTLPGRKQIHRGDGVDVLALFDEPGPAATRPLLSPWMLDGRRVRAPEALSDVQARARSARDAVTGAGSRVVQLSAGLARQAETAATRHRV